MSNDVVAPKWSTFWRDLEGEPIEIFVSPSGHWYKRARGSDSVDFEQPLRHGLPPIRLTNIDHWRTAT